MLSKVSVDAIKSRLKEYEGYRRLPYRCTEGYLTIGIGRNLESVGLSESESEYLLVNDIQQAVQDCENTFPWFKKLTHGRKEVLVEMRFQLGIDGVKKFKNMLKFVEDGKYTEASQEMINSAWHKQTPRRCEELAHRMFVG